jgi:hypothetical protein
MTNDLSSMAFMQTSCGIQTKCGLDRALAYLYGTAGLLTLVLIVVIAAAFVIYLHNRGRDPQ